MNVSKTICLVLLAVILGGSSLFAQTAMLRGQVSEESGAVLPGATVVLTGGNGQVTTAVTDQTGSYTLAGVAPGNYVVEASAPRLKQPQPAKVTLKSGAQSLNLILRIASLSEKVTVPGYQQAREHPRGAFGSERRLSIRPRRHPGFRRSQ
jgi:hypothetical protein